MVEQTETLTIDSPLGPLALCATPTALTEVRLAAPSPSAAGLPRPQPSAAVSQPVSALGSQARHQARRLLAQAAQQLDEYFAGGRKVFTLPLQPQGTPFQQAAWRQLRAIPYGQTQSYQAVARALGRPGAARAVGGACHANPLLLFVPCHRVCAASGGLGGFALGLAAKRLLLALEQKHL